MQLVLCNVMSSVLWCSLRIPHNNDFRLVFTSSCLYESSCLIYIICVCFSHSGVQHILWGFFFVRLVYHMLPASLNCSCLTAPSVFSIVYCVLCFKCCHFLWIVQFLLPLRYSLTFNYLHYISIDAILWS